MRSTLALLLLFGAFIGVYATDTCTLYKVPDEKPCEIDIKWKVYNVKQATATCLEYFPTTFVKGVQKDDATITCRVEPAFQCKQAPPGSFLMFDKCYFFPKTSNGAYVEDTVPEYKDKSKDLCKGGKLSVFYSHSHAKFIGMKAHDLGIDKLWIGITKDGKSLENHNMMHSKLWKLIEGNYWDSDGNGNDFLNAIPDPKNVPAEAEYIFMRTRDDQFIERFQGRFERASKKIKATFACEFEAKFTGAQKWYCDKMGILGFDAVYDASDMQQRSRCLYVSANSYTWNGQYAGMRDNIKGCKESPSKQHSAGMDDGSASKESYAALKFKNTSRLAGFMYESGRTDDWYKEQFAEAACSVTPSTKNNFKLNARFFDHNGKMKTDHTSLIDWDSKYPMNECSDFPSKSSTIGLRNGIKVNMHPEVLAPAICSLVFFQECENTNPCGSNVECKNTNEFQPHSNPKFQGFFTCQCHGSDLAAALSDSNSKPPLVLPYVETEDSVGQKTCTWNQNLDGYCALLHFYKNDRTTMQNHKEYTGYMEKNKKTSLIDTFPFNALHTLYNDKLDKVVVRAGCKVTVRGADTLDLIHDAGFGTHDVPTAERDTLPPGVEAGFGASSLVCSC